MSTLEANFDGLVGPTHNYAGLSYGNVASTRHGGRDSNPKKAALEGLAKMRFLMERGIPQGVLPPQERPLLPAMRALGFQGSDADVLGQVRRASPVLLAQFWSASSMWAANAATVVPSADAADGKVHFVPANLVSTFHRSLEPETTARALQRIFADEHRFTHHGPLPSHAAFGDEGAANHTRLEVGGRACHLFAYGRSAFETASAAPERFPARQTLGASQAVARLARLDKTPVIYAQQSPAVIDQGVFHNDVISVGHRHAFLYHVEAFVETEVVIEGLSRELGPSFRPLRVRSRELSVADAVSSYLFNSQLVSRPDGRLLLVAPFEARENVAARAVVERLVSAGDPIAEAVFLDVRESMQNGGGPACLRLRVPLTEDELEAVHGPALLDGLKIDALSAWVEKHYRDRITPSDLIDPALVDECHRALDELTGVLELGSDFYGFQRNAA